ncbi:hypothetical protein SAMN04489712_106228 [Thermomonospora echinospora]|uniref:Uncharacterized protein n=1 Tax=Thermomonospora echinospora TaxID=1992 RepID=A0A1H6B3H6_9ACTN|nr:hypothetical protein [Thermomonospora echinospora]SEG55391.1 hypothetical protein SAMN04489712_106228 [Thermomonospora echinospora]
MESAQDLLGALARRYAFGDLGALAGRALPPEAAARVAALCAFGQRVLELDAEDFGMPEAAGEVPVDLLDRARASRMPQSPRERPRGALATLHPGYALLLEVIGIHWRRREMAALVGVIHIVSEYLPVLAWEPVLGHAADPALLPAAVTGPDSRFGTALDPDAPRRCGHTQAERSACARSLRVAREPAAGWRAYLDRQHSQVAQALGVCAAECRTPCSVITRLEDKERAALVARCTLAHTFTESALVRLRHSAPVGHGFGVPSCEEVEEAWARACASLRRQPLGEAALADAGQDSYPLPGLPALVSAIAGAPIAPGTLLRDVTHRLVSVLAS